MVVGTPRCGVFCHAASLRRKSGSVNPAQLSFQLRVSRYTGGDALAANTRHEPVFVRQPVAGQSVLRLAHAGFERRQRGEGQVHPAGDCRRPRAALFRQPARAAVRGADGPHRRHQRRIALQHASSTPSPARARLSRCRRRACPASSARATSRRNEMAAPTPAAATACRRRTPPTGLPRRWSRFFFTGAACGSCCRWRWAFPFRASITACIIRATFWPARFWARATPPPPSSGCKPRGTGSGKNGFRSGTSKCHRC